MPLERTNNIQVNLRQTHSFSSARWRGAMFARHTQKVFSHQSQKITSVTRTSPALVRIAVYLYSVERQRTTAVYFRKSQLVHGMFCLSGFFLYNFKYPDLTTTILLWLRSYLINGQRNSVNLNLLFITRKKDRMKAKFSRNTHGDYIN